MIGALVHSVVFAFMLATRYSKGERISDSYDKLVFDQLAANLQQGYGDQVSHAS